MIRNSFKRLSSIRVPSYYDRFAKPQPPASVSSLESTKLCESVNAAIKCSTSQNFAILNVEANQVRVTDGDLLEVPADWPCRAGDQIKFENVLSAGSTDFTLVGRPTISSDIVEVIGTCVEKRINETPFVRFRNPRAPRKPALSFKREIYTTFRINSVNLKPILN
ncbi:unnamed protein product [Oikopleura dioica]|uniref:Large ribosomal subunit protein bL21m n=1 Tax=Oikopleura dioica TaxID=34765 RepID=E4WZX8_OIKDI|nr:unnamed protein product [Oikopleura dioica]